MQGGGYVSVYAVTPEQDNHKTRKGQRKMRKLILLTMMFVMFASVTVNAQEVSANVTYGGWIQAGTHSYNTGMFNNKDDSVSLHQGWLFIDKEASGEDGVGWGFHMDYVYGVDGPDTQAFFGQDDAWDNSWDNGDFYGHAIPQLYGQVAMGDASVKVGHFYTIMGYEVVQAPDNFFFSHAFTMFNSEPFTHTGVLGEYALGNVTLYGGWTLGWDSGFGTSVPDGNNLLGGISVGLGDIGAVIYTTTAGRLGAGGLSSGYSHSIVVDLNLTDRLNYVFQSDYVDNPAANESHGVNNYLLFALTEQVSVGTRVEWWNTNVGPVASDLFSVTSGMKIQVTDNIIARPEIRWDQDDDGAIVPAGADGVGFGMDVILTF
jgi:hypothetical protein